MAKIKIILIVICITIAVLFTGTYVFASLEYDSFRDQFVIEGVLRSDASRFVIGQFVPSGAGADFISVGNNLIFSVSLDPQGQMEPLVNDSGMGMKLERDPNVEKYISSLILSNGVIDAPPEMNELLITSDRDLDFVATEVRVSVTPSSTGEVPLLILGNNSGIVTGGAANNAQPNTLISRNANIKMLVPIDDPANKSGAIQIRNNPNNNLSIGSGNDASVFQLGDNKLKPNRLYVGNEGTELLCRVIDITPANGNWDQKTLAGKTQCPQGYYVYDIDMNTKQDQWNRPPRLLDYNFYPYVYERNIGGSMVCCKGCGINAIVQPECNPKIFNY